MRHTRTAIFLVSTVLMAAAVGTATPPKTGERYAFSTSREQAGGVLTLKVRFVATGEEWARR